MSLDKRTSTACRVTGCTRLYRCTVVRLKFLSSVIHFPKNNMKRRYVLTVVITFHTLIPNEIHHWLNRVFMSLLSPLAEPADNESETDGHLTRMGPRLIMNICIIFPGPVFSQCKVANSEFLLHNHTCAQVIVLKPVLARYSIVAKNSAPYKRHV